ncbi:hypothetical protein C0J52_07183 [Blattella germanica]|nr:hypothetical protein C0J52_07183 [Blattella germanica]
MSNNICFFVSIVRRQTIKIPQSLNMRYKTQYIAAYRRYLIQMILMILIVCIMLYPLLFRSSSILKPNEQPQSQEESLKIPDLFDTESTNENMEIKEAILTRRTAENISSKETMEGSPFKRSSTTNDTNFTNRHHLEEEPTRGDDHIIFLETSCVLDENDNSINYNKRGLDLNPRTACAVESAARMNEMRKIYVIYSCPIMGPIENSSEHVMQMLEYPNVRIWKLNVTDYLEDTPLEKSLNELGSNYVGAQSPIYLANAALNFRSEGVGQVVAHLCIRDLQKKFNGSVWGMIGPELITRVMGSICGNTEIQLMTKEECLGFTVHPPEVFYNIAYTRNKLFFNANYSNTIMQELKGSFAVHLWNKYTSSLNITVGSNQPYGLLAEEFCPRVYSNCGNIF